MPEIHVVELSEGIPEQQAVALISQGWRVYSKVTIGPGKQNIVLPRAQQPVRVVDIWVSPDEPMVPLSFLAGSLVTLKQNGEGDWVTLDKLARGLIGMSLKEVEKRVQFTDPDGEAGGQRDEGVVGEDRDSTASILQFPGGGVDGG